MIQLKKTTTKKITQHKAGWKDGQALFYETLPATAMGPISTTSVD